MRFTSPSRTIPSICLAIYGCGQLDRVADFINNSGEYVEDGVTFTPGMIAGQYAFEQVKLDRKGYDTRRLQKYLSFLADAGAYFSEEEALQRADDLINNFTADFGHDEDGDATFRIKAQSYRLKKYDFNAKYSRSIAPKRKNINITKKLRRNSGFICEYCYWTGNSCKP